MMKLYVLTRHQDNQIIALSESKDDIANYVTKKKFPNDEYFFSKVKNHDQIDNLMFEYDELYLEHDPHLDTVLTRIELELLNSIIDEEKQRVETTIADLEHYISDYSFDKKEKSILLKAHKILESNRRKKKLKKVISLENFIGIIDRSRNSAKLMRDRLHSMSARMYIFIHNDEKDDE
jgi:hypothetical protein